MTSPAQITVVSMLFGVGLYFAPYCSAAEAAAVPVVKEAKRPLPPSVKITRTPNAFASVSPSSKRFEVDCKIIALPKDRSDKVRKNDSFEIRMPTVAINDGEAVTIEDTERKVFEIARSSEGSVPITREVWQGTKCEICVIGTDDGRVVVDVSAELQSANAFGEPPRRAGDNARSVQVGNVSGRLFKSLELGEVAKATFESIAIEVVVKELSK